MNMATQCTLCLEPFQPRPSLGNHDKRPIASQKCNHSPFCVDCFQSKLSREPGAWIDCPICKRRSAFQRDDYWVNDVFCMLLAKGDEEGLSPSRWTASPEQALPLPAPSSGRKRSILNGYDREDGTDEPRGPRHMRRSRKKESVEEVPQPDVPASQAGNNDITVPVASASEDSIPYSMPTPTDSDPSGAEGAKAAQIVTPVKTETIKIPSPTTRRLFTKAEFLKNQLFHLNPLTTSMKEDGAPRENYGFGPFIAGSMATIRFSNTTPEYLELMANGITDRKDIRRVLMTEYGKSGGDITKVTIWLRDVQVGDFILMRHEYPECPYLPARLLDDNGAYIGPVYVLGVITETPAIHQPGVLPWVESRMDELADEERNGEVAFCRVEFLRMGKKEILEESTKKYISSVQQPTLNNICKVGKVFARCQTDAESIRRDLWEKASMPIRAEDFQ